MRPDLSLRVVSIFCCFCYLLLGFLISPAQGEWWRDKNLKEKLALTDTQVSEMEEVFTAYQKSQVDLQAEVKKAQIELKRLMSQKTLGREQVEKEVDALSQKRQQMLKEMVRMKLSVRGILTQGQVEALLAEDPDIFTIGRRWAGLKGMVVRKGNVIVKEGEQK